MWNSWTFAARLATIEELRIELTSEGIECPGVLVIGAQSAGKSSVLERLTGISFPRAENTCTRVPTIVQLQTDQKLKSPKAFVSRDASFSDAAECKNMSQIQQAILDQTQMSVSDSEPIKDEPIHIKYIRSRGPLMTLIDLPGITHVDAKNEGFDIHAVTSAMVHKYTNNENMIVLVVIPANDDFGNSEALRIAQKYDTKGTRTIGVVSKCDLVPENSDIVQKIQMSRDNDVKLALGFIAVRNKGPGEENVDLQASETKVFKAHPRLKQLRPHERGYDSLSTKIVELQTKRVELFIPEVRALVRNKLKELRQKLQALGHHPLTDADRREVLSKEICAMDAFLARATCGNASKSPLSNISARCHDLSLEFSDRIKSAVPDWLGEEMEGRLVEAMKEAKGHTLPNFMSHSIFWEMFVGTFFATNGDECFSALDGVIGQSTATLTEDTFTLMNNAIGNFVRTRQAYTQFPKLGSALLEEAMELLCKAQLRAVDVAKEVILAERNQAYTQNSAYMSNVRDTNELISRLNIGTKIKELVQGRDDGCDGYDGYEDYEGCGMYRTRKLDRYFLDNEKQVQSLSDDSKKNFVQMHGTKAPCAKPADQKNVVQLQISLECYADIVMRRIFDTIPMLVFSVLVCQLHASFHHTMQCAFNDDYLRNLFEENVSVRCEREKLEARLERMTEAEAKLKALLWASFQLESKNCNCVKLVDDLRLSKLAFAQDATRSLLIVRFLKLENAYMVPLIPVGMQGLACRKLTYLWHIEERLADTKSTGVTDVLDSFFSLLQRRLACSVPIICISCQSHMSLFFNRSYKAIARQRTALLQNMPQSLPVLDI